MNLADFSSVYADLYSQIASASPNWLTISPPRRDGKPSTLYKRDKETFLCNIKKFASKYIIVAEIANDRLHYHIFYSLSNKIYRFKYLGGIAETLHYQYKDYKGEPKEGKEWEDVLGNKRKPIDYLFKDVDEAIDYGIKNPVLTQDDFKKKKKVKEFINNSYVYDNIPQWMLVGIDDT